MAKHRTALGRMIDLNELVSRHEKTRAVGNMKVNARGDTIDAYGKVVESVTNKVNKSYSKTVGNRSAQPVRNAPKVRRPGADAGTSKRAMPPVAPPVAPPVQQEPEMELTEQEKLMEEEFEDDIEVEQIKQQESKE